MHQDPIESGLVASLRRPGGTMTGLTLYRSDEGKRLELLREVAPRARRLGVIIDEVVGPGARRPVPSAAVLERFARDQFGFEVEYFQVDTLEVLERLPAQARAHAVEAWYVPPTRLGFDHPGSPGARDFVDTEPAVYALSMHALNGGLISYQTVFENPSRAGRR
jgi:putative ABC transport system substrate-binding protein